MTDETRLEEIRSEEKEHLARELKRRTARARKEELTRIRRSYEIAGDKESRKLEEVEDDFREAVSK